MDNYEANNGDQAIKKLDIFPLTNGNKRSIFDSSHLTKLKCLFLSSFLIISMSNGRDYVYLIELIFSVQRPICSELVVETLMKVVE